MVCTTERWPILANTPAQQLFYKTLRIECYDSMLFIQSCIKVGFYHAFTMINAPHDLQPIS
jgi:hypothetical protein